MNIDSATLNNWIQIIGIAAVGADFVGMQMRQTQEITELQSQLLTQSGHYKFPPHICIPNFGTDSSDKGNS